MKIHQLLQENIDLENINPNIINLLADQWEQNGKNNIRYELGLDHKNSFYLYPHRSLKDFFYLDRSLRDFIKDLDLDLEKSYLSKESSGASGWGPLRTEFNLYLVWSNADIIFVLNHNKSILNKKLNELDPDSDMATQWAAAFEIAPRHREAWLYDKKQKKTILPNL